MCREDGKLPNDPVAARKATIRLMKAIQAKRPNEPATIETLIGILEDARKQFNQ